MRIAVMGLPDEPALFVRAFGRFAELTGLKADLWMISPPAVLGEVLPRCEALCLFPPYDADAIKMAGFAEYKAVERGRGELAELAGGKLLLYSAPREEKDPVEWAAEAVSLFSEKAIKRRTVGQVRYELSKL